MANADKPFGFRFGYTLHGGPPAVHTYVNTAVAIYPGDCVMLDGSGAINTCTQATSSMGVALNYVDATAGQTVYVYDDLKNTIFIAQADGTDISNSTKTGLFLDVTYTTGDTTTFQGQQEIDSDKTANDTLELIGKVDKPDNAYGGWVDCYVRFHVDTQMPIIVRTAS
jgi:hypothetical protein